MLTSRQLTDFILKAWDEMRPNSPALKLKDSTVNYLAERVLDEFVIIPKENYKNYEQWMRWMQSVDDRLGVICAAINMMDVPRRPMRLDDSGNPSEKGRRKRIVVRIEDAESDGGINEPNESQ